MRRCATTSEPDEPARLRGKPLSRPPPPHVQQEGVITTAALPNVRGPATQAGPLGREWMERVWKNEGAMGRNGSGVSKPGNRVNKPIVLPPAATSCRLDRMVRRGSAVRVRQRGSRKACKKAYLCVLLFP